MKQRIGVFTIAIAALALLCQGAEAGPRKRGVDPRVAVAGTVVGAGSTVGFLALNDWKWNGSWNTQRSSGITTGGAYTLTTIGCIAVSPMVATAVVGRELTFREAHVLAAGCVLPIIGGWLMNAAYDANPHWEPAPRKVRVRR
jgi:hypothetical protein